MGSSLKDISRVAERTLRGNTVSEKAGIAIHGTNTENILVAGAYDYSIGGVAYAKAADAEIDFSAEVTVPAALADLYTQVFVLAVNAAGAYECYPGEAVLTSDIVAGTEVPKGPENIPATHVPFAAIKVANATGSAFTLGTTGLDTAGITDTYYDLMGVVPVDFS